jgi:hypothetical protein
MEHFIDEHDRLELHQLLIQQDGAKNQLEDLLLKYSLRDKKQKFAFHLCSRCLHTRRKKFQSKVHASEDQQYALVRLEGID